jgi:phage-related protein
LREEVKWTNLSRRAISRKLEELGTPVGKDFVSELLRKHRYRLRKTQKRQTMGQHADRNAKFEKIAQVKEEFLKAGKPVISIDTKMKDLLWNFFRSGMTDAQDPTIVNYHDFISSSNGTMIPHGIYDLAKTKLRSI